MFSWYNKFRHYDLPLLIISGLLLLVGLVVLYATSLSGGTLQIFYRQLIYAVLAIILFFLVSNYDYHKMAKQNRILYVVLIILLFGLLLFGREIRGSARWIDFGIFRLQPAEFAKIIVGVGLARWFYLKRGQINSVKNIALTLLYAGLPAVLIFLEPDLGSTLIVLGIWGGLLLISSIRRKYLLAIFLGGILLAGLSWQFLLADYQKIRVEVFLNPEKDPRGRGYNVRQAIISVGSGQFWGRGLGKGLQSQLKFLPERQTDFIFASAAEEIGFVGCAALLVLYYLLLWRLMKIMQYAKDDLGYYIVGAVLFLFLTQIIINIGMNIGLLPVTGIPLPFLTYGGSSLVVTFLALAIVQNIARQSRILRF
jgi:rod shape determining protein RodA